MTTRLDIYDCIVMNVEEKNGFVMLSLQETRTYEGTDTVHNYKAFMRQENYAKNVCAIGDHLIASGSISAKAKQKKDGSWFNALQIWIHSIYHLRTEEMSCPDPEETLRETEQQDVDIPF